MCLRINKNNGMKAMRPITSHVMSWRGLEHNYSNACMLQWRKMSLRELIWLDEVTLPVSGRAVACASRAAFVVLCHAARVIYFTSISSSLKDHRNIQSMILQCHIHSWGNTPWAHKYSCMLWPSCRTHRWPEGRGPRSVFRGSLLFLLFIHLMSFIFHFSLILVFNIPCD